MTLYNRYVLINNIYLNRNKPLTTALINIIQPNQRIFELILSKLVSHKLLVTIILFLI